MSPRTSSKRRLSRLAAIVVLAGALLMGASWAVLEAITVNETRSVVSEVADYAKQRLIRFENYQATDTSKSLVRLSDKTEALSREISERGGATQEYLADYAYEQRLDGIALFDSNLTIENEWGDKDEVGAVWSKVLETGDNVTNIISYPKKVYFSRIWVGDSQYDFAALARTDAPGIVFTFAKKTEAPASDNELSLSTVFTGYSIEKGGVIALSDGSHVISTNAESVEDKSVGDAESLANGVEIDQTTGYLMVTTAHGSWIGSKSTVDGYSLYVFFPKAEINAMRNTTLLLIFVAYVVAVLVIALVRMQVVRQNMARMEASAEEARRASAAKTDFLRRMSHDVRTPINGIRGMIEIANSCPDDIAKQEECRQKVWDASGYLLDLVNSMLDMSKLEGGEVALEEKPFNLRELMRGAAAVLEPQAKGVGLSFTLDVDVEHEDLIGSPMHLRQVVENLGTNAVKYNVNGGTVRLSCRETSCEGERAAFRITCTDTGIGMSPEFQKRAFEPFQQENPELRTVYRGTGLGLAICREIVEHMGGAISLESEKGKGSTFAIDIAFAIDRASHSASCEEALGETPSIAGMNVLVAEDNALNGEIAQFILEGAGARVTLVENGARVVEVFEASAPYAFDAVLMDVMMPVMDGLEAARRIRGLDHEDAKSVPIIATTANAFADDAERSREAGMDEHLSKPLDSEQLVRELARFRAARLGGPISKE